MNECDVKLEDEKWMWDVTYYKLKLLFYIISSILASRLYKHHLDEFPLPQVSRVNSLTASEAPGSAHRSH